MQFVCAAEEVWLIASTIYWWLSCQRFYALMHTHTQPTLAATAFLWANCWVLHWLPISISRNGIWSTGHVKVTLATTAVARKSVVVNEVLIQAIQGSREAANLTRSGQDWERADWTWQQCFKFAHVIIGSYSFQPGVTAVHVRFQPASLPILSVLVKMSTMLPLVVMIGGWK